LYLVINLNFFFRVSNITGTIFLEKEDSVALPGENVNIKVVFVESAILNVGLRFVMREGKLTIGAGIILQLLDQVN